MDGECFTSIEAHFNYGSFDPCASVNIPDFMDFIAQRKKIVEFTKLCLKGRKLARRKNR